MLEAMLFLVSSGLTPNVAPPPFNGQPVAVDDTATVRCNTIVGIDVLQNDSDPDGDPLVIDSVFATGGNAQNGGTYIEFDTTESGTFYIYYTVSDGHGGSATATLVVTTPRGRTCDN